MKDKEVKKNENVKESKIDRKIVLIAYFFILFLAWFDFYNLKPGNEFGFTFLYFYLLLPVITLIVSIYIGKDDRIGNIKWLLVILLAVLYMSPLFVLTFKERTLLEILKNYYDMIINGAIVSLVGMLIGTAARKYQNKKAKGNK